MFKYVKDYWVILSILSSFAVIVPITAILSFIFSPESIAWDHLTSTVLDIYVINSFVIASLVFVFTIVIGTSTAWLVSMYNFRLSKYIQWLLILPLSIPSYALCYVYSDLIGFDGYIYNIFSNIFGLNISFINFYSIEGAVFVFTFSLYPYVYILARQSFLSQSVSYIEISRISGYSLLEVFRKTSIPFARPAIIGGATLVIMETLADYGVADFLGIDTFTKGIYRTWFNLADINAAGKLSAILLLSIFVIIIAERYLRGNAKYNNNIRNHKTFSKVKLNGFHEILALLICLIPIVLGFIIPFITLFYWVVQNYDYWDLYSYLNILLSSFSLAFLAALLCMIFAIIIVYGLRVNHKLVSPFARIASMGYSIPGAVAAIGILLPLIWFDNIVNFFTNSLFNLDVNLLLTGTWLALLFAYLVRFLALSIQSVENSFIGVSLSLDYSAKILGASHITIIKNILIRLNFGGICLGLLIVFVDVLKELPATMILRPYDLSTLAIKAHELAMDERLYEASLPLITIIIVCLFPLFIINIITQSNKKKEF